MKRQYEPVVLLNGRDSWAALPAPHEVKELPYPSDLNDLGNPIWPDCEARVRPDGGEWRPCPRKATWHVQAVRMGTEGQVEAYDLWRKLCAAHAGHYKAARQSWDLAQPRERETVKGPVLR